MRNLSQTGNTAGSGSFGSPIGLGVEGITPGLLGNMGMGGATPLAGMGMTGGVGMSVTMSDLGLTASGGLSLPKRNEDEERRAKIRKVLHSIGRSSGRISEEGIARCGRRVGFENSFGMGEEAKEVGDRIISMSGAKLLVDVDLKQHAPRNVQVLFDSENEGLAAQAEAAGRVLLGDLQVEEGLGGLGRRLERFAEDLERLASVDRLCVQQVNCFEALSGVYLSLRRLYEQEVGAAAELEVMRKKSGRPTVHANGRLGTEVEYWQERTQRKHSANTDGDATATSRGNEQHAPDNDIYRLRLGIQSSPAGLYPSIRLSDTWLPDPLDLPAADAPQVTPWQDPPPTLIPPVTDPDAAILDPTPKLPDLRFTAQLDPPVVLPWQVASTLFQSVGLPAPQVFIMQAWHSLVLDPATTAPFNAASKDASTLRAKRGVATLRGEEGEVTHEYTLDVVKPDMAFKLEELPFAHPRQVVEMLPLLRQWACFGSLLRGIFADDEVDSDAGSNTTKQAPLSLADLLSEGVAVGGASLPVHIALTTSPTPTLALTFPTAEAGSSLANIVVRVLPNAELVVSHWEGLGNGVDDSGTGGADDSGLVMEEGADGVDDREGKKMARALEVCGDLGVWVGWLRGGGR